MQRKIISDNRRARFEYSIEEEYDAGIVLKGTEVKSLRMGKISLDGSHAAESDGEIFLFNVHIAEYDKCFNFSHYPKRPRKLLLKSREIKKIIGAIQKKGMTLVPLKIYFNAKNIVKVIIAIAKGKKLYDKRQDIKEREWKRKLQRIEN
ncbi:MAG: SsrA-binding protein SmpB [Proteobacteria bacterium]|nr:SsrA-binding protein SmpB [Pseudomonadota bacterium]